MSKNIENINEQVENQQVEEYEETLKRLINEILNDPGKYPTESKVILILETWGRQGPSYTDYNRYSILTGDAMEVVLNEIDEGYPYRIVRKVAIIPLTLPVVVEEEHYCDTTDPIQFRKCIHIFTSDGWKSTRVY
jgi:hypothetical protein